MFTGLVALFADLHENCCFRPSVYAARDETRHKLQRLRSILFPIGVLLGLGFWYYVYVVVFAVQQHLLPGPLFNVAAGVVFLVLFHVLFLLLLWSFLRTMLADPGYRPNDPSDPRTAEFDEKVQVASDGIGFLEVKHGHKRTGYAGMVRDCTTCQERYSLSSAPVKPDRCHHCKTCRRCILKMDHHCPWVGNCIGFFNYKAFLLTLIYTIVLSLYSVLCLVSDFAITLQQPNLRFDAKQIQILIIFILNVVVLVGVCFFFAYHVELLVKNTTTLEDLDAQHKKNIPIGGYDVGWRQNIKQVFGDRWYLWGLPVFSALSDGIVFPRSVLAS